MADFSNKVIYQIYPKSFKDSNGDGIGDLRGVAEKLDYLKDLGVDYLWLTPFFVSPQRDNGYDVADYRNIDPMFGTMEDLDNLIAEGEKRNIGLMFDMVFNHTSTSHEWFRRALAGEKKYQDYYIFKEVLLLQMSELRFCRERRIKSIQKAVISGRRHIVRYVRDFGRRKVFFLNRTTNFVWNCRWKMSEKQ